MLSINSLFQFTLQDSLQTAVERYSKRDQATTNVCFEVIAFCDSVALESIFNVFSFLR